MAYRIIPVNSAEPRSPRKIIPVHCDMIRMLNCVVCGCAGKTQLAHIRYADARYAKPQTGMGTRPDDWWTLPLCVDCHLNGDDAQHNSGEREWWQRQGADPIAIALALYLVSPDLVRARRIIIEWNYHITKHKEGIRQ